MKDRHESHRVTDVPPAFSERLRTRQRWYFAIMGICILLILLAWNVVRFYSTDLAIAMSPSGWADSVQSCSDPRSGQQERTE